MDEYIKKSEAVDVIEKYPYNIAGKTATAIKMIENLPSADVVPKSEVEKLNAEIEVLKAERNNCQTWYFKAVTKLGDAEAEVETLKDNNEHLAVMLEEARSEVNRLHDILLQFTDIVHKWGAKNNIDTSEISLVPILQEEADGIIKKAKSEVERLQAEKDALIENYAECMKDYAREIFAEIYEDCFDQFGHINYEALAETKKKYIGE